MNPTTQRGRRVLKRTAGALAVLLAFGAQAILAQLHTVTGTVTSAKDNSALPGVNIIEVGTQTGAMTDARGQYTLALSNPNASLAFSFVGYLRQTVAVGGRSTVNVALEEDVRMLEEVVVTSFGIERRERAVGFSVSKIDGAELAEIRETNIANSLAGKVAGVMVQKPATGSSGSSRVEIRGSASLGGGQDNQPLYVVDGVPIDNTVLGQAGMWGGWDGGDGVSSLNPDDIENISVLKGPAAAALYGSRAKNGVILVTTKTAKTGTGLGIEFNSNTTFENILTNTDFQDVYGQGSRGVRPVTVQEARDTNTSAWGEKLDGSPTIQWDGVQRPYSMVENNLANFYQTGITSTNTLALSAATQQSATRFNVTHLTNQGLQPYSGLERTTFTMRSTANLGSKWTADAKLNFIREYVKNRPRLSDAPGNANYAVYSLAPNVGVQHMKCPIDPATGAPIPEEQCTPGVGLDGKEYTIWDNIYAQNPWFAAHNMKQTDEDRRLIGFFSLQHQFTDWLSLMGRFGGDTYTTRRTNLEPYGLAYNTLGRLWEEEFRISEVNTDFLLIADKAFQSGERTFGINATLGGNLLYRQREDLRLDGSGGFNVPTLVTVTNQRNPSIGYGFNEKQINSLYGSTELSYNDYLFLTLTARNDWSSTLPLDNNSYFYPSVGLSLVFSDLLQMPSWVTFANCAGRGRKSVGILTRTN
jgi:TonB-linked SusC/RagA family outer membrane protein